MAKKTKKLGLPAKSKDKRAPHVHDAKKGTLPINDPGVCQTWDDDLVKRLVELGKKYQIDEYAPVVAMAEMAMDPLLDERLRFNCHKEVAKYVRLKRQIEPTINIQQNVYELPPEQRRMRIDELTKMIADTHKVIEHDG